MCVENTGTLGLCAESTRFAGVVQRTIREDPNLQRHDNHIIIDEWAGQLLVSKRLGSVLK